MASTARKTRSLPAIFENDDAGHPQLFFNRGAATGDIYVSELDDGVWANPTPVDELNTPGTDQRPSITPDGLAIYFWSDRDGSADLWVAQRPTPTSPWSEPVRVEFPTDDRPAIMPFIYSRGRTQALYFVRPFPLASRDLWMTERTLLGGPK